jgi:uncharacterized repeat protein (TIGR02543 family)
LARTGYTYNGWNTAADGSGVHYDAEETYTNNAALTLYAQWTSNPDAPTATAATSITKTGFTANWESVSGATGYRLDVSTKSDFSAYVTGYQGKDVGNVTASAVSVLSEATVYYYRVRAEKDGLASDSSNTISVTTSDGTGVPADVQDAAPNNGDGNGDGTQGSPIVDQGGVARVTAIPTLNEWGMILLAILLGIGAFWYMRKRVVQEGC